MHACMHASLSWTCTYTRMPACNAHITCIHGIFISCRQWIHKCLHACMHAYMHTWHKYVHACIYICMHTCVLACSINTYMLTCKRVWTAPLPITIRKAHTYMHAHMDHIFFACTYFIPIHVNENMCVLYHIHTCMHASMHGIHDITSHTWCQQTCMNTRLPCMLHLHTYILTCIHTCIHAYMHACVHVFTTTWVQT